LMVIGLIRIQLKYCFATDLGSVDITTGLPER